VRIARDCAVIASLAARLACGDDGGSRDAGGPPGDGGVRTTCSPDVRVDGDEGVTSHIDVDTRRGTSGFNGWDCPNLLDSSTPYLVVAYRVPGEGMHTVRFTTSNEGTSERFDTVVAVRREDCLAPPRDIVFSCFDDIDFSDYRSRGAIWAMGGDTVHFVVTGYFSGLADYVDRGRARLDVEATPNEAPVVESAIARRIEATAEVEVTATDADADAQGIVVSFHDETKALVDVSGDGRADAGDVWFWPFDVSVVGATRFTETATLSFDLTTTAATGAWVQVYDEGGVTSAAVAVPLGTGQRVGLAEACDGMRLCSRELSCGGGTCGPTPERAAACAAAMPIDVPAPSGTTTSRASAMGTLVAGAGIFSGPCGSTTGTERMFRVTVPPAARVDLVARTDTSGTPPDVDTVVYVRRDCVDPASGSVEWCSDDVVGSRQSVAVVLDAMPGEYTVFVEDFAGVTALSPQRFEVEVGLRPILSSGAACDPTSADNRCADGDCTADSRVCP
jgi:hypothetical protein